MVVRALASGAVAVGVQLAFTAGTAAAAASTPVTASSAEVGQLLFVAGDVGRLGQIPSGTEDVVLEKVLQQLYIEHPTIAPAQAESNIKALEAALNSGAQAISPATLTVMAGNQRILAILRALTATNPPADVLHAIAQVSDQALTGASRSTQMLGQAFNASADSLDTLAYSSFSPAQTLAQTASLAAANNLFGQARDALWKQASGESVFDGAQTLIAENRVLQSSAIQSLMAPVGADGTLTTTVGQLEALINAGVAQISNQNCALAPGTTGASPSDCASGALRDAQHVAQQCPTGATSAAGCQAARNQAQTDATAELSIIAAQQAATAAEADALGYADPALQQAEVAEAQAAAQVADEENQYLDYQSFQQLENGGFDIASLAVTLARSEIDPAAAFSGLLGVLGDAIGFSFSGPDANTIILQGLQNVSQQISDFEQYTQTAFGVLDTQLSNLSTQIAQDAYQLSAQLTQAQQQLTQLGTQLTTLQGSVDHLQSEVQSLFAQGARNDLGTLINQYIGYQQANGVPLAQSQFATAAGALYQDATSTALTQTVLTVPSGFDALGASNLVTGSDPLSLDSNINFFNLFPLQVTDSPSSISWPGALTTTCAPNANPAQGLCLPDPDFWATSARAFGQLLTENPAYVTPTRVQQLNTVEQEGQLIANALRQLSVNDAGSDPNGTGNLRLDAAINYYRYWGSGTHTPGVAPTLPQALHNEAGIYLSGQFVPGQTAVSDVGVDPWGGVQQTPDVNTLVGFTSFKKVPLCPATQAQVPTTYRNIQLPSLTVGTVGFLPRPVLNAVRLGIGHIAPCWTASSGLVQGNPNIILNVTMTITYNYVSNDGAVNEQVGQTTGTSDNDPDCTAADSGLQVDAIVTAAAGWLGANQACNDLSPVLGLAAGQTTSLPADVTNVLTGPLQARYSSLQTGIYNDILSNGSTLTTGTSEATNVQDAAMRLQGASAIADGYISFGLPQALGADDTLHGLVAGINADAFAPNDPNLNLWGVAPASTVPDQLVNFYKGALAAMPAFDPANFADDLDSVRATALEQAIRPHIVPAIGTAWLTRSTVPRPAVDVPGPPASTAFAESDALIGPTLDRLDETQTALTDALNNGATLYVSLAGSGGGTVSGSGISCPGTCSKNYTPGASETLTASPSNGSTFTGWRGACSGTVTCTVLMSYDQNVTATFAAAPTAGAGSSPPAAGPATVAGTPGSPPAAGGAGTPTRSPVAPKCTLKPRSNKVLLKAPKRSTVKPGRLTLTLRCGQAAKVRVTGTLIRRIGRKPKHGKQGSVTSRLRPLSALVTANRALTLTVQLPAAALAALGRGASESVSLTLTATGSSGATGRATATIARLKGTH